MIRKKKKEGKKKAKSPRTEKSERKPYQDAISEAYEDGGYEGIAGEFSRTDMADESLTDNSNAEGGESSEDGWSGNPPKLLVLLQNPSPKTLRLLFLFHVTSLLFMAVPMAVEQPLSQIFLH